MRASQLKSERDYISAAKDAIKAHEIADAEELLDSGLRKFPQNQKLLELRLIRSLKKPNPDRSITVNRAFKTAHDYKSQQPENIHIQGLFMLQAAMSSDESTAIPIADKLFRAKMLKQESPIRMLPALATFQRFGKDIGAQIPEGTPERNLAQLAHYQQGTQAEKLQELTSVLTRGKTDLHLLYAIELSGIFREITRPTGESFLIKPERDECRALFRNGDLTNG